MSFIGVVCEGKKFDIIKKLLQKSMNKNEYTLINLNRKSISNLKNVRFDVIVFLENLKYFEFESKNFHEIYKGVKYLVVNSDIEFQNNVVPNIEVNIITFGLNHLATVTISSVTDENILISIQRSFINSKGNTIDVGEYNNSIEKIYRSYMYEVLACFIISII